MKKALSILLMIMLSCSLIFSQDIKQDAEQDANNESFSKLLVKTNALADILTIANLGLEINLNSKFSIDLPVYYSPYNLGEYKKVRVFIVQPEVKYWLSHTPFEGHYFGANISTGWYNVALSKKKRYQDNKMIMGVGFTYGYYYPLPDSKFLIGGHVGVGYNHFNYNIFSNSADCKQKIGADTKNYWGITQVGFTIAYKINL